MQFRRGGGHFGQGGQQGDSGKHAGGGAAGFAGRTVEGTAGVSVRSSGVSRWVRVSTASTRIAPARSAPRAHSEAAHYPPHGYLVRILLQHNKIN